MHSHLKAFAETFDTQLGGFHIESFAYGGQFDDTLVVDDVGDLAKLHECGLAVLDVTLLGMSGQRFHAMDSHSEAIANEFDIGAQRGGLLGSGKWHFGAEFGIQLITCFVQLIL